MTQDDIVKIIDFIRNFKTETNSIETKSAKYGCPQKYYDTISSFSNKNGGVIVFGIDEDNNFEINDVYDINDLQKRISALCTDCMEPAVRPEFFPCEIDGKKILLVKINEIMQSKKPCYYKPKGLIKGAYTRVGDRDEVMTDYEIYALQSYNDGIKEDLRPNKRASIDDLDKECIEDYIKKVKQDKPNFAKSNNEKILKLSGISDHADGVTYPTLAGTMIFSEYPQAFYPQLFIACAVIPGRELGDIGEMGQRFDDNKRVEGTIEQMLEGALAFLRKNMKNRIVIDPKTGKRENIPEYPMLALREAIANALIHRDYSIQTENAYIQVYMYYDRIVIQNPGALYGINKIEKLGTDTIMESRNSTIVRILEEKGSMIENRHSGIPTMIREMKKMNLPEPEFVEERGSFKVIFRNNIENYEKIMLEFENPKTNLSGQQTGQQTGQQNGLLERYRQEVINFCKKPKTSQEIRDYLKISSRTYISTNIIKPLIDMKKIEYTNKNSINAKNQKYVTVQDSDVRGE